MEGLEKENVNLQWHTVNNHELTIRLKTKNQ